MKPMISNHFALLLFSSIICSACTPHHTSGYANNFEDAFNPDGAPTQNLDPLNTDAFQLKTENNIQKSKTTISEDELIPFANN